MRCSARTSGRARRDLFLRCCTGWRPRPAVARWQSAAAAGGLGALSNALASAAIASGVQIRTATLVERILVEGHRAAGVVLQSGETFAADAVISNADPKTTFLRLLGTEHLDTGFMRRVATCAPAALPRNCIWRWTGCPRLPACRPQRMRGRLLIAPSLDYLERAFNHSKYGEFSSRRSGNHVPSVNDPALRPRASTCCRR